MTAAVVRIHPQPTSDPDTLLDIIADHADRIADGDALADQESLRTARAVTQLFEAEEWSAEFDAVKPAKPDALGVVKTRSERRFVEWLRWREGKAGRRSLTGAYVNYLRSAEAIASRVNGVNTATEYTVRPLAWLLKNGKTEDLSAVWSIAVELAEGGPVTNDHTRQAVAMYKKKIGPKQVRAAIRTAKAARDRGRAMAYVRQLWADGDDAEAEKFDTWYKDFRRGKAV